MIRVTALIRPHKLEEVKSAIAALGVTGMTVSDVRGSGNNPEKATQLGGHKILISLPIRSKIVICAPDEMQEDLIETILMSARTSEPGDGKVFVEKILDSIRIRTLERGEIGL